MSPRRWGDFDQIWSIDFEFATTCPTGRPIPHTFVATEVNTGRQIRLEGDALRAAREVPFDVQNSLTLAYNFVAESQCFEALGWEQPWWPLDLYAEHRALTNGEMEADPFDKAEGEHRVRYRQLDAMRHHGLPVDEGKEAHKKAMQIRAGKGEPFDPEERVTITDYCADDTTDLAKLFVAMRDRIDLPAALVRGRYMVVIGQQTYRGIPVDVERVRTFLATRPGLRLDLIAEHDGASQFFRGGRFDQSLFFGWTRDLEIGWPQTEHGRPVLQKDTMKRIAALDPRVRPLQQLRSKLSKLDDMIFDVRSDGRIRPNFWPMATRTGRNGPKAREYPLLKAKWSRGFVEAPIGRALAQLDFKAQEVYVAAKLSEDRQLLSDLEGDPYLSFAIRSGFAEPGATKESHGPLRDMFKIAMLSTIYGAGERTLASNLGIDVATAREIRRQFRRQYRVLWEWLEDVVATAYASLWLETAHGWPLIVGPKLDSFTLRNHLIQATGGDILRASCLYAQDEGLCTIATLHDSILAEADERDIDAHAARLASAMTRGSESVIGLPIPAEVEFTGRRYRLKGEPRRLFEEVMTRAGEAGIGGGG
jgi:hypothetical protein